MTSLASTVATLDYKTWKKKKIIIITDEKSVLMGIMFTRKATQQQLIYS